MSCQIQLIATINEVISIRRCLFPTDDARGSDNWLQLCKISVSPTGDVIAIAHERRLVLLSSKWDPISASNYYNISYSGSIHDSDNIRALLCLPVINQSKSSHVVPDWTCLVVGFDSGDVKFFTETFELLLEEQFHNEPIGNIKCQSQHNPRSDISPDLHQEELYIQYQSNICVLPGSQLFPVLRTCRTELAKVGASNSIFEPVQGMLIPKKWGFQDQASISDIAVVGINLHSTFDYLLTVSTCGGFETKYRSSAPYNNLILATGSRPFVGFHYALEGCPQPVFTDVAKAVASKLKSALPGWLTGNKAQVDKQMTAAMQPADAMTCRFGLCDLRRTATNIILSPDHKLAAISDALGRVILMDAHRGISLRIFKGYREAQCSFIQVPDERHSKHRTGNKVALFLVIYSPKKGTLEIFTVQQGLKVATFSASKYSRLVYINYGLMGFTTTSKSRYVCQFNTVFIDNDGLIKEIVIPFHFALNETNSGRARDIHLYKKLKRLLKCEETNSISAEAFDICAEIKTSELKLQTVELLLESKTVPIGVSLKCVQYFLENCDESEDKLKIVSSNSCLLFDFYQFLSSDDSEKDIENGNLEQSNTTLNIGIKEMKNLQKLLDLSTLSNKKLELKVAFSDMENLNPSQFLSVFDITNPNVIELKPEIDNTVSFQTSEMIFKKYITGISKNFELFQSQITKCKIPIKSLFVLLINYWVHRSLRFDTNLEKELTNLSSLVYVLAKSATDDDVTPDYGDISKFWSNIREMLANSSRPFPALTAAILCKNVAQKIDRLANLELSSSFEDDSMEVLSQESIEWSLLIGKLEDVSLLNILLSNNPVASDCTLPKLRHEKNDISLIFILNKGKGSVSELVARWLTLCGINPENIALNDEILKLENDNASSTSSSSGDPDDLPDQTKPIPEETINLIKSEQALNQLNLMKAQFPYSLEASTILANMCWEYALEWQKDIQNLDNLEAAIKCLTHIPNSHIKEGLYNLVWNTHLKIIFECTCKLINKVGKLPKARLCIQDTGLTDYQIVSFFNISTNFLDAYMDVVKSCINIPKPILHFEQIWENGGQPLVELALQQNQINYDLLHLHYQLSLSLNLLTTFSVKHSKPVYNLFEGYMIQLFFADFQTKAQINWDYSDTKVQTSRIQFLFKVISASLETVTVNDESRIFAGEHIRWMSKCITIAKLWNLDTDLLRRYQILQIYTNGFDSFGDELYSGINERDKLGPELLAVAAKRLSQFLDTNPNYCQNMAVLSTAVTNYIKSLNDDWCAPSSLKRIENIILRSLNGMKHGQYEYRIGEMLLDGCQSLMQLNPEENS